MFDLSLFWETMRVQLRIFRFSFWLSLMLALVCFVSGFLFYSQVLSPVPVRGSQIIYHFFYMQSGLSMLLALILSAPLIAEDFASRMVTHYKLTYASLRMILWSKFASALLYMTLFHVLTLVFPLFVYEQTRENLLLILNGFFVLTLLSASVVGCSLFCSSLVSSPWMASFLSSVILGIGLILWMLVPLVHPVLGDLLTNLSFHHLHFARLGRGIINLRDVVYYLVLTWGFMEIALLVFTHRLGRQLFWTQNRGLWSFLIFLLISLNLPNKTFTQSRDLSPKVKELISHMPGLEMVVFLTELEEERLQWEEYSRQLREASPEVSLVLTRLDQSPELARRFSASSEGMLYLRWQGHGESLDYAEEGARDFALKETFPQELELALARLSGERKTIFLSQGHGELGSESSSGDRLQVLQLQHDLRKLGFEIKNWDSRSALSHHGKAILMVLGPKVPFSQKEKQDVRQFLKRGGALWWSFESYHWGELPQDKKEAIAGELQDFGVSLQDPIPNIQTWDDWEFVPHNMTPSIWQTTPPSWVVFYPRFLKVTNSQNDGGFTPVIRSGKNPEDIFLATLSQESGAKVVVSATSLWLSDLMYPNPVSQKLVQGFLQWHFPQDPVLEISHEQKKEAFFYFSRQTDHGWFYLMLFGIPLFLLILSVVNRRPKFHG